MSWLQKKFELSRGLHGGTVLSMEGLRGFAVFLVFLVHYSTLIDPWIAKQPGIHAFFSALHSVGNTGVDLFFVLSGYLIYGSLIPRSQPFLQFMSRRVMRIYPAFIVVFITYIALSFVFPAESKIPHGGYEGTLYLTQNFLLFPGLFHIVPMNTVAGSLSYEMFYYLTIPLVIILFGLRYKDYLYRIFFFSAIAIIFLIYCALYGGPERLVMFISGILLYEVSKNNVIAVPKSTVAIFALFIGLLSTLLPIQGSLGSVIKITILSISFFAVCLVCFCRAGSWITKAFTWTPLRWLGNMSYSYYLIHGLALKVGFLILAIVIHPANQGIFFVVAMLPFMFMLTLFPSVALFLAVERPFSLTSKRSIKTAAGTAVSIDNCSDNASA